MITELTEQQKKYLPIFRQKMFKIGCNCDEIDKKQTEKVITKFYKKMKKKEPVFIFCDSPLTCNVMINIIKNKASLRDSLWDSLGDSLLASLGDSLWASLGASLGALNIQNKYTDLWGQQDIFWIAYYKFYEYIGIKYKRKDRELLADWYKLSKSCMWWYPYENYCIVSNRPEKINWNETKEYLHSYIEPAVLFRDGWSIYYIDGIKVEERLIKEPLKITIEEIEKEINQEIKRIKIQVYDYHRYSGAYINDSGAKFINKDNVGELYKKEVLNDEPIVMVRVKNSTYNTNGSQDEYWLRVPPDIKTARQAIAWTFGMQEHEYKPVIET